MPNKKMFEQGYKKYVSKAKDYIENKEKTTHLLQKATKKATKRKNILGESWEMIQLLFDVSRAWIKGEYREIPKGSIIMIIATILYFVSPIDLTPDWIVGLGFFDDTAVIAFTFRQISKDLEKYKLWKKEQIDY